MPRRVLTQFLKEQWLGAGPPGFPRLQLAGSPSLSSPVALASQTSSVATEEMSSVATEEMSSVATEGMSSVATEEASSVEMSENEVPRGLNGIAMDRHGLILWENEAMGSRKVFRCLMDLRDALF